MNQTIDPYEKAHSHRHELGAETDVFYRISTIERNEVISERAIGLDRIPTPKEKLKAVLDGPWGIYLDILNASLSLISCLMYLMEVYQVSFYNQSVFLYTELIMSLYFTVDFGMHMYTSDDAVKYAISPLGIIDIITIIPAFVMVFVNANLASFAVIRVFRVFRALRILRLYRLIDKPNKNPRKGYNFELGVFIFSIGAIIFVAAGLFQALEQGIYEEEGGDFYFHDGLYFVLVTISTVGYGDIAPRSTLSKFFVMVLIVSILTLVPRQLNRLVDLANASDKFDGEYPSRSSNTYALNCAYRQCCLTSNEGTTEESIDHGHLILCGDTIPVDTLSMFLTEFYHISRGNISRDIVLLTKIGPSPEAVKVVTNFRLKKNVYFLKGSILEAHDQERVKLREADAVFFLGNKYSAFPEDDDMLTILQAESVKQYSARYLCNTNIFTQMISTIGNFKLGSITGVNQEINTIALENAILARSVVCPGACSLLLNLMRSHNFEFDSRRQPPWIEEYGCGINREIYTIHLSSNFNGYSFRNAARIVYDTHNALLIGKYIKNSQGKYYTQLWPMNSILQSNDHCFIIADSAYIVHVINNGFGKGGSSNNHVVDNNRGLHASRSHSSMAATYNDTFKNKWRLSSENLGENAIQDSDRVWYSTSIIDEIDDSTFGNNKHILVCGPPLPNFVGTIKSLRIIYEKEYDMIPPIVILTAEIPSFKQWKSFLRDIPQVYFMEGSSINCNDLLKARSMFALKVLVLPYEFNTKTDPLMSNETSDDTAEERSTMILNRKDHGVAASLFSLQAIRIRKNKRDKYLKCDNIDLCKNKGQASPYYEVESQPIAVLNRAINSGLCGIPSNSHDDYFINPSYAAGHIFITSLLNYLLCQAYFNPHIAELIKLLAGGYHDHPPCCEEVYRPTDQYSNNRLLQIPISSEYIGKTFGYLFNHLLNTDFLAIGLYRANKMAVGNSLPYSFTCPHKETLIYEGDFVFVVGLS